MKVFITRSIPEDGIQLLKSKGYTLNVYKGDGPIPPKALKAGIKDADAVITLLTDKIDSGVIDSMNKCRIIANYAVGYNNIDVEYAARKGIAVTNTPGVLTDSTADLTLALTLACARRVVESHNYMLEGKFSGWKPKLLLGMELKGKTFGILGAGRIGEASALRAKAFGTKILYFDNKRNLNLEDKTGARKVSLEVLLRSADIISLHLPLNEGTKNILDKDKLSLVKSTSILINTARGELMDEGHLIKMLRSKKLAAAGFDVYEGEPDVNSALYKLDNVVLLPHIGSATNEARGQMSLLAAKNVIAVLSGKKPVTPVK